MAKQVQGTPWLVDAVTGDIVGFQDADGSEHPLPYLNAKGSYFYNSLGYEDLSFAASGINPIGAASDPTVDITLTDFPGSLLFSGSIENIIAGTVQCTHSRRIGSKIYPHIHWSTPTGTAASGVSWTAYYRISVAGKPATAWSNAVAGTLSVDAGTAANSEHITTFGEIAFPEGYDLPSANVSFRLHRLGNTDSYNGTARLLFIDFHENRDSLGSGQEYVK